MRTNYSLSVSTTGLWKLLSVVVVASCVVLVLSSTLPGDGARDSRAHAATGLPESLLLETESRAELLNITTDDLSSALASPLLAGVCEVGSARESGSVLDVELVTIAGAGAPCPIGHTMARREFSM